MYQFVKIRIIKIFVFYICVIDASTEHSQFYRAGALLKRPIKGNSCRYSLKECNTWYYLFIRMETKVNYVLEAENKVCLDILFLIQPHWCIKQQKCPLTQTRMYHFVPFTGSELHFIQFSEQMFRRNQYSLCKNYTYFL